MRDPDHAALRRAARVTLVAVPLFALCLSFADLQLSLFAVFGAIALLAFADFGGELPSRARAYLVLTAAGTALISLGTVLSDAPWAAAACMALVGFVVTFAGVVGGYVAASGLAALLAFVLAVTVPADAGDIPDRLAGWALAGVVCAGAAVVLWPRRERHLIRRAAAATARALAELVAATADAPPDPAKLQTRRTAAAGSTGALEDRYQATPYRPAGPTVHDQSLAFLVAELHRTQEFADLVAASGMKDGALSEDDRRLATAVAKALRETERELPSKGTDLDLGAFEAERELHLRALGEWLARVVAGRVDPDEVAARLHRSFRIRIVSFATLSVAVNTALLGGARVSEADFQFAPLVPPEGTPATARRLGEILRSHVRLESVWCRAGIRAAVALGVAILVAGLARLDHGFWIGLGAMSVLKSNAVGTSHTAWQAIFGTVGGFGLASAFFAAAGETRAALWVALPICLFLAIYTPTAVHFVIGQAMFTVTVVLLFNLIEPQGWRTGLIRVEDIGIGTATSVVAGVLMWPRGARGQLPRSIASLLDTGGEYVHAALRAAIGREPASGAVAAKEESRLSSLRASEAFSTYLNERGPKNLPVPTWARLIAGGKQVRFVADILLGTSRARGVTRGFPEAESRLDAAAAALERTAAEIGRSLTAPGEEVTEAASAGTGELAHDVVLAGLRGLGSDGSRAESALTLALVADLVAHARYVLDRMGEPVEQARAYVARPWWR